MRLFSFGSSAGRSLQSQSSLQSNSGPQGGSGSGSASNPFMNPLSDDKNAAQNTVVNEANKLGLNKESPNAMQRYIAAMELAQETNQFQQSFSSSDGGMQGGSANNGNNGLSQRIDTARSMINRLDTMG